MLPQIKTLPQKIFIGKRLTMSFTNNKTFELWRSFMPHRKEISNAVGAELYSIEVYPPLYFDKFSPDNNFEKWAAVEVAGSAIVPDDMEILTSPVGLYAVFMHKGPASDGPKTYQYIFMDWLPNSGYLIDERPHFAIMGEKYKGDDPNSEEEILIPVKFK